MVGFIWFSYASTIFQYKISQNITKPFQYHFPAELIMLLKTIKPFLYFFFIIVGMCLNNVYIPHIPSGYNNYFSLICLKVPLMLLVLIFHQYSFSSQHSKISNLMSSFQKLYSEAGKEKGQFCHILLE